MLEMGPRLFPRYHLKQNQTECKNINCRRRYVQLPVKLADLVRRLVINNTFFSSCIGLLLVFRWYSGTV